MTTVPPNRMASNPAIMAPWLQSARLVAAVADLYLGR